MHNVRVPQLLESCLTMSMLKEIGVLAKKQPKNVSAHASSVLRARESDECPARESVH
jgi:hypothetical protein